ncbi:acetyltransferase [Endothiovibrio diazotrophicus]
MFLKEQKSGDLVEVLDLESLFDPNRDRVHGRFHAGEEMPDPSDFAKPDLAFPSGEALPRCWTDPHYRA